MTTSPSVDHLYIKEALALLQKRNRTLALLNLVGQTLTSTLDIKQVMARLLQSALDLINAEDSSLWLWDLEYQGWLVCEAVSHEHKNQSMLNLRLRPGEGIVGWVAEYGKSALVPANVRHDSRFDQQIDGMIASSSTRSLLAVPLRTQEQLIGVLEVVNKIGGPFTAQDQSLLEMLAIWGSIAVDNARLFAQVQRMATTDELTKLRNRRSFFAIANHEFERARRYQHPLSAIMLDIDYFKKVNDTYGHAAGDDVLRHVAQLCRSHTRGVDILGRYGGEEFAIVLPETPLEAALQVAERLRSMVEAHVVTLNGQVLQVTVSLGVATMDDEMASLNVLLDNADMALYAAKQGGRNQVQVKRNNE